MAKKQVVLVTGASSGIGLSIAQRLSQQGWLVFAGYRGEASKLLLEERLGPGGKAIHLDVTTQGDIESVAGVLKAVLSEGDRFALINNAGISIAGPVELLSMADFRRQYEVNVFGLLGITKALLPLLKSCQGRLINISSVYGKVSMPGVAAYSSAKYALEAISDAMRLELKKAGVVVTLVEPGAVKTEIWEKSAAELNSLWDRHSPELCDFYSEVRNFTEGSNKSGKETGVDPSRVAEVVQKILADAHPRARYIVGSDSKMAILAKWLLPDRWWDQLIAKISGFA